MKIVHVVDSMEMGGAETLVSQMCQLQREQGHDVSVYSIAALGILGERMREDGFEVSANIGRNLIGSTQNLYRLFKRSRPDVVHIHNPTPTIYGAPAARMSGAATVISTRHSLVAPPHDRTAEFKFSLAARCCDYVVGICEATTNNLKRLNTVPKSKIIRVYNGAAALSRPSGTEIPVKTGFTLVFVGRLQPVKNLSLLLDAFQFALKSASELRLWIVGDGPERTSLEAQARKLQITDEVRFWGQQMNVAPFLAGADSFIMSSRSEGLPVSLLQAFSLGTPAIVTDVGGMAEVVRLANGGVVSRDQEPSAIAEAILRMKNDEAQRRQYAANAIEAFAKDFSLSKMVERYMELYRSTPRGRELGIPEVHSLRSFGDSV